MLALASCSPARIVSAPDRDAAPADASADAAPHVDLSIRSSTSTTPRPTDVEVAQALRRYVGAGELDAAAAAAALADLRALGLERHAHEPLLDRVWELRKNLTAYDAVYVALAEALDTTLLTCDGRLARAPGMARRVELVA